MNRNYLHTDTELGTEMLDSVFGGYDTGRDNNGYIGSGRAICPYCGSEKTDKLIFDVYMKQESTDRAYFYCSRCCKEFFRCVSLAESADNDRSAAHVWAQ